MTNPTDLKKPNRISIWLMTEEGYIDYTTPKSEGGYGYGDDYFDGFVTTDPADQKFADLGEGLDYCFAKIKGEIVEKEYGFAVIKKLANGKAGACYCSAHYLTSGTVEELEQNIIAKVQQWCIDNGQTPNGPVVNFDEDRSLIITIDTI